MNLKALDQQSKQNIVTSTFKMVNTEAREHTLWLKENTFLKNSKTGGQKHKEIFTADKEI